MTNDGRLICANCRQALNMHHYMNTDSPLDSMQRQSDMKKIRYRIKNCPGDPWCQFTDAEKQKLCQEEEF